VWYSRLDVDELHTMLNEAQARKLEPGVLRKAHQATSLGALDKLTTLVDGQRRIVDAPPLVEHLPERRQSIDVPVVVRRYRRSLSDDTRTLLKRYRVIDWARKVVGVGSVGTDDAVVLLLGDSDRDPLFLQVKEAQASVLERLTARSRYTNHGQRVVAGQRLTQAASDIFLGWTRMEQRDYYVRQLRDIERARCRSRNCRPMSWFSTPAHVAPRSPAATRDREIRWRSLAISALATPLTEQPASSPSRMRIRPSAITRRLRRPCDPVAESWAHAESRRRWACTSCRYSRIGGSPGRVRGPFRAAARGQSDDGAGELIASVATARLDQRVVGDRILLETQGLQPDRRHHAHAARAIADGAAPR
jgi:hypothetical protein